MSAPSIAPFDAPDTLAPYVDRVLAHLMSNPGRTVVEIQNELDIGENTARAALERLASLRRVHCTLRPAPRGAPPREYRPGPAPISVS